MVGGEAGSVLSGHFFFWFPLENQESSSLLQRLLLELSLCDIQVPPPP